jgi:chromosome segregation ATPase
MDTSHIAQQLQAQIQQDQRALADARRKLQLAETELERKETEEEKLKELVDHLENKLKQHERDAENIAHQLKKAA